MIFLQKNLSALLLMVILQQINISLTAQLSDTEEECEAEEDSVEKCAFNFLLFRNETFVQSNPEMSQFCGEQKNVEKCLSDHSKKCLSHSAKQAIGELIRVMYKQNENICSNKAQRRLFQRSSTCLSNHQTTINACYQKFISDIHGLHQFGQEEKMPLICCTYTAFQNCILESIKDKCSNDVSTSISRLINVYAGETLNYVCRDYKTSSKCNNFQKPNIDLTKVQEEIPKTFFSLLVKIYLS